MSSEMRLLQYPLRKLLAIRLTGIVSDIAIFVLKRDVKLQLTNSPDRQNWSQTIRKHTV